MKLITKRSLVTLTICAICTLTFLVLWWGQFPLLQEAEFRTQDWQTRLGRKTPVDDRLVFIGMDKPIYESEFSSEELQAEPRLALLQKNYPWSRAVWARLVEKLAEAGAKVIVIDIVFASEGDSDGDAEFKRMLNKYRDRVVIAYDIIERKGDWTIFRSLLLPNSSVIEADAERSLVEDDRLGYVKVWPDRDGILRRVDFRKTGGQLEHILPDEIVMESLDARVLRKFGHPELLPAGFDSRLFRYTAPPSVGYRPIPVGDVLSPKLWATNYASGEFFKDKIVLIGPAAEIFHDKHDTPFADPKSMLGPEVHLNIINAALHGEFLNEPPRRDQLCLIGLAGALAAALGAFFHQPLKRFLAMTVLTIGYAAFTHFVFVRPGVAAQVLLVATPALVLLLSGVSSLTYDYFLERFEKRRIRKTLERYVSRDVVKDLLDNPQTFFNTLGGVRKPVTILFSDVRGFTTLTESADSHALVKQLNEYFEAMVAHVFGHQGSLDKFIGDAVMAVWGSIVSQGREKDALNAVGTALAMKESLKKLNADWKSRGMIELAFGIGINHGEVIVGNLGSSEKMELTVIGDAVNLASRLEGLTKEYHLDLLLGESVAGLVRDTYLLRTVDYVQVKGKTKPVDVFTVYGEGGGETISLPAWLARYEEGVRLYRQRAFADAAAAFQESLRGQPDDFLTAMYLKRCQALIETPPGESWDGVFVMTKK